MKATFFSVALALAATSAAQSFQPLDCSSLENSCRTAKDANQAFCSSQAAACGKCEKSENSCRTAQDANQAYCSAMRAKCDSNVPQLNGMTNNDDSPATYAVSSTIISTATVSAPAAAQTYSSATVSEEVSSSASATVVVGATSSASMPAVQPIVTSAAVPSIAAPANTTLPAGPGAPTPPPSTGAASGFTIASKGAALVALVAGIAALL